MTPTPTMPALPERLIVSDGYIVYPLKLNKSKVVAMSHDPVMSAELVRRYNCHEQLVIACRDAIESLGRMPETGGAYRTTVLQELKAALAAADECANGTA
jgi:hypothetical protein